MTRQEKEKISIKLTKIMFKHLNKHEHEPKDVAIMVLSSTEAIIRFLFREYGTKNYKRNSKALKRDTIRYINDYLNRDYTDAEWWFKDDADEAELPECIQQIDERNKIASHGDHSE